VNDSRKDVAAANLLPHELCSANKKRPYLLGRFALEELWAGGD